MKPLICTTFALLGTVSLAFSATTLINVDLNQSGGGGGSFSGAAVLGAAGDSWNGINLTATSPTSLAATALNWSDGTSSGITVAMTNFYAPSDLTGVSPYDGNIDPTFQPLMIDYAYIYAGNGTAPGPVTITLSGFQANQTLTSIVLFGANTAGQNATFTIGGIGKTTSDTGGIGTTLTEGDEYVRFDNVTTDGSGNLAVTWTNPAGGSNWSVFNGMQIAVPEPSAALLGGLGLLALLRRRR